MKIYLFLYPIKKYFEYSFSEVATILQENNLTPRRIDQIIDTRYRQNNFQIIWLVFADTIHDQKNNCLNSISPYITIHKNDIILKSELTFSQMEKSLYPQEKIIYEKIVKLTGPIEKITLGGFHQNDCVEKIAKCFHNLDIYTQIDEETTELFFTITAHNKKEIPLTRSKPTTLEDLGVSENFLELARKCRKDKPWLTQA